MSWFNTSGISSFAKSAISQAQKSIDKVLDIKEENEGSRTSTKSDNISKSKSYTEGNSRSRQNQNYKDEDDEDGEYDGRRNMRNERRKTLEEDSFFSSFLGSDRHSTPKVKSEIENKSTISSKIDPDHSDTTDGKSISKNEGSSSLLSNYNIESKTKIEKSQEGNIKYNINKSLNKESTKIKSKGDTKRGIKERDDTDLLEEVLNESDSNNEMVAKTKSKKSTKEDTKEKDGSDLVEGVLKKKNSHSNKMITIETEIAKCESVLDDKGSVFRTIGSASYRHGSEVLKVQNDNYGSDDDENSEYFDASNNVTFDDSKCYEKGLNKQDDIGREEMLSKPGEEDTKKNLIDQFSNEHSNNQSTDSDDFENDMKSSYVKNVVNENDVPTPESFEDENIIYTDRTVKETDVVGVISQEIKNNEAENEIEESKGAMNVRGKNDDEKGITPPDDDSVCHLSNKGNFEENIKSDFAEKCISEQSEKISDIMEENLPAGITKNSNTDEDSFGTNETLLVGEIKDGFDEFDNSNSGISSEKFVGSDQRDSVDIIGNDAGSQGNKSLNSTSNSLSEDNLQVVGNDGNTASLTSKPEHAMEDTSMTNPSTIEYQKEIKRLKEVVDARESKMVTLSKENIDLQEAVSILRSQLEQAQQIESGENEMIREMRDEFTSIVDEMRIELRTVKKERDELKRNLEETMNRLTKNSEDLVEDYTRTIKEKEDQIAGLLAEGEALSKKELKSNNLVKKFRSKVKTLEEKSEQDKKRIEEKDTELSKLREIMKEKIEQEKVMKEQMKNLEMITDQQEDENSKLKDQLDDAEDKLKGMQTTLDSGYQEINRLSLEKANIESEIEEIKQLKTTKVEFESRILELEDQAKHEKLAHLEELSNLRLVLTRTEQSSARREDNLQMEIKDLQHRLDGAESRNQELSQSIATASRPLLRQIENLQSSHQNQSQNWERIEKSLNERLATAQQQLTHVTEKERSAVDFAMEMKSRVSGLELQIKTLREQKEELSINVEKLKESSKIAEENLNKERKSLEIYQSNYKKAFEELQNEKIYIEDQLNAERAKHEAEILKLSSEYKVKGQVSRQNSANTVQLSSIDGKMEADEVEPDTSQSLARSRASSVSSSSNFIDTSNKHTSTAIMEKMQTQLRQKDGELKLHKEEIDSLQKTRTSLAQELVSLSNLVEELQEKITGYDSMKTKYQEVESRYNAVLQLYGEKVEEADELRMDLEDIKLMYKQQIQQLVGDR